MLAHLLAALLPRYAMAQISLHTVSSLETTRVRGAYHASTRACNHSALQRAAPRHNDRSDRWRALRISEKQRQALQREKYLTGEEKQSIWRMTAKRRNIKHGVAKRDIMAECGK